jgi:hypothetical protein
LVSFFHELQVGITAHCGFLNARKCQIAEGFPARVGFDSLRSVKAFIGPWMVLFLACAPPAEEGKGGDCHSLSDCKPGLACIEGKCSTDLKTVKGTVPKYTTDAGAGMAAGDGGAAGAAGKDGG